MEFISQVIYVDNVEEVLDFYYQAFGFNTIYGLSPIARQ